MVGIGEPPKGLDQRELGPRGGRDCPAWDDGKKTEIVVNREKLAKRSGDERARKANKTEESLASCDETPSWDLTKEGSESTTPTVCGAEIVACGGSRGSR